MNANPFCAARFAPGALPWIEADQAELERWTATACVRGARHQVLGAHGSGKTTLLIELERRARRLGWSVVRFRAGRDRARFPRSAAPLLVLIDEFESAGAARRALWLARARLLDAAVLVAAHRDVGLATLCRRRTDAELARALVARLIGDGDVALPTPDELDRALQRHGGNLREVFFELYDQVERARPRSTARIPALTPG